MEEIAVFEKVSYKRFREDYIKLNEIDPKKFSESDDLKLMEVYCDIELPRRATSGSAGHDFKMPYEVKLEPGKCVNIPSGIRCQIENGWVLKLYPRSGMGSKYKMRLNNTVGIIDSDYYGSDNEGHILARISVEDDTELKIEKGQGFMQGIFLQFGVTVGDDVTEKRNGGFNSTENHKFKI